MASGDQRRITGSVFAIQIHCNFATLLDTISDGNVARDKWQLSSPYLYRRTQNGQLKPVGLHLSSVS